MQWEAYLRQYSLSEQGIVVDSKRLPDERTDKAQVDRLQRLIQSNPDDVRVKGDREHIVLRISWSLQRQGLLNSRFARGEELPLPENLRELQLADLVTVTSLSIDDHKEVLPVRCEYENYMALVVYFPRVLPDGQPLVVKGDKKLRFRTRLGNSKITAEFDLQKMVCQGRIET